MRTPEFRAVSILNLGPAVVVSSLVFRVLLFSCCSDNGRPPIISKHSFLLMKRKRTARRTIKSPIVD
jgi:hypothetical protein